MIHPTAIVDPRAEIDPSVEIGPYSVIDAGVKVAANCWLGPHVHLTGHTSIGANNRFHAGCVIGDAPQDVKYKGEPTRLVIGENNIFREHFTAHRSNSEKEDTTIGSNNMFMSGSHVAHNCHIGNFVIVANGGLIAGHATVEDRAFISGTCLIHQFARVGTLAMMQGGSGISKDLPPFTVATGANTICGLNVVGLRRNGYSSEARLELRQLYHALFMTDEPFRAALAAARDKYTGDASRRMLDFIAASKRGVCSHRDRRDSSSDSE